MSVNIDQVWLTGDAYGRLTRELATLLEQRTRAGVDVDEQEQREVRIRQLHELLRNAVVHEPPDDGVAEPGMVVTVRYEGEDDDETFLLADREGAAVAGDVEVCSPRSPLGRALIGAVPGDRREYRTPDGALVRVTLARAVPHGHGTA